MFDISLSVRRFVEGQICRKCARCFVWSILNSVHFNLLCVLIWSQQPVRKNLYHLYLIVQVFGASWTSKWKWSCSMISTSSDSLPAVSSSSAVSIWFFNLYQFILPKFRHNNDYGILGIVCLQNTQKIGVLPLMGIFAKRNHIHIIFWVIIDY